MDSRNAGMRSLYPCHAVRLPRAICGAVGGIVLAVIAFAELRAQDTLARSGEHDRDIVLRDHAGWDRNCAAVAPPLLHLDAPPRHGTVCARSDNIRIEYISYGTQSQCIGRTVRGLRLVYRPHASYAGTDDIRYSVQYPTSRRAVAVSVTVTPPPPATSGAAPARIAWPPPQPPGPVPPCNDAVS
jgi:hypothetical protein